MHFDRTKRFASLGQPSPILNALSAAVDRMLNQLSAQAQTFQNSEDANLGHLEEALKKPMGEFLTEVLQQAAQQKADGIPPKCTKCGTPLIRKQKLGRTMNVGIGESKLTRVNGFCPKCKKWCCPADEALGLENGYSPHVQEMAALFASKMPLAEASAVLERATGIKMAPATLDRVAKRVAEKAQELREKTDAQARQGGEALAVQSVAKPPQTLVILLDAWNIRERDDWGQSEKMRQKGLEPKRWHWVCTGTVFGLEQRVEKGKRPIILHRGYVATRQGVGALSAQLHAEALRHGLGKAQRVIVLGDGAAWIWNLAQDRFSEAIQRVDLYHIKQHLWVVAKELHPDPVQAKLWVKKMKNQLRRGQSAKVISAIEQAVESLGDRASASLEKEINYLKENQKRMDYASALRRGEPVGSGAIESTCAQYQCRFKRTGQFWTTRGDELMMGLETSWRNERWHWLFPHIKGFDPSKN
jgi:hypothetical protein